MEYNGTTVNSETGISEARQRVLDEAERLFSERGLAAVTLRDIATAIGIRHASLYHHFPGGKLELFKEVMERNFHRHRLGIEQAIMDADINIGAHLRAAAEWLLSQPPMDLIRMTHSDLSSIEDNAEAYRLMQLAYDAVIGPVEAAIRAAAARGEINAVQPGLIAGGFVGMIESLHAVPAHIKPDRPQMAHDLIDVLLNGLLQPEIRDS